MVLFQVKNPSGRLAVLVLKVIRNQNHGSREESTCAQPSLRIMSTEVFNLQHGTIPGLMTSK